MRLVKGANLAMEHAEAELHGWTAAPYPTKADVDASYARLLDVALNERWTSVVRVGVASHNLFHLAWALEVARARGVAAQVDVEMLEGMANAEAVALARAGEAVILYTPVTRRDDFASAVAYLVRRLEENTSPENYLSAAFAIGRDRCGVRRTVRGASPTPSFAATASPVTSRRFHPPVQDLTTFANARDGDPVDPAYVESVLEAFDEVARDTDSCRRARVADAEAGARPRRRRRTRGIATPSRTRERVDDTVSRARGAAAGWEARGPEGRARVLGDVAHRDGRAPRPLVGGDGARRRQDRSPRATRR